MGERILTGNRISKGTGTFKENIRQYVGDAIKYINKRYKNQMDQNMKEKYKSELFNGFYVIFKHSIMRTCTLREI